MKAVDGYLLPLYPLERAVKRKLYLQMSRLAFAFEPRLSLYRSRDNVGKNEVDYRKARHITKKSAPFVGRLLDGHQVPERGRANIQHFNYVLQVHVYHVRATNPAGIRPPSALQRPSKMLTAMLTMLTKR